MKWKGMVHRNEPDLREQIYDYFRRNPDEALTAQDASIKFDKAYKTSRACLRMMANEMILRKCPGESVMDAEYILEPQKKGPRT
jgi:hypothetical protein